MAQDAHSIRSVSAPPAQRQEPGQPPGQRPSPLGAAAAAVAANARSQGTGGGGAQRRAAPVVGPAHEAALAALRKRLGRDGQAVFDEYDRICRPAALDETPCSVAEARENAGANRYFNVLPFDFNRVRLQGEGGDYINASEVTSRPGEVPAWAYVATQAPLPATTADFWRCVWGCRSGVVLMLTREVEAGVRKCHAYLPRAAGEAPQHGAITVRLQTLREVDADITHRRLVLEHAPSGESRALDHFQYHAWPDHGVPRTTRPLRALARLLEDSGAHAPGPAVVHCSAGIGRTGTFCAIDIALRRLRALDPRDIAAGAEAVRVKRIVARLRKQRAGMVQTPDQYLFCHLALKEELEEALLGREPAGGTGLRPPAPAPASGPSGPASQGRGEPQQPPPQQQQQPLPHGVLTALRGQPAGGGGPASGEQLALGPGASDGGASSPRSSASGQSPRSPGSGGLHRRPSGAGGWAGLISGASSAADPWASLTRTSGERK